MTLPSLFLLGLLGSGHCVGMCGPLIVAFPARQGGWAAHVAYNFGRIATYVGLGALVGSIGAGLAHYGADGSFVWTVRIQVGLSLLAGVFLGIFGLSKLGLLREPRLLSDAHPGRIPGFRRLRRSLIEQENGGSAVAVARLFLLGAVLGLLPCGLSFAALARTVAARSPREGASMMLAFGVGTLPSLLAVGASASWLNARYRRLSEIIAGITMVGLSASLLTAAL